MKADRTAARRRLLREILSRRMVRHQRELVEQLHRSGYEVTQATVSRDLAAIGAEKRPANDGGERYVLSELEPAPGRPRPAVATVLHTWLVRMVAAGNLVVVRTLPAGAGPVASALDGAELREVVGTVAGDDTVLVVTASAAAAARFKTRMDELVESGR